MIGLPFFTLIAVAAILLTAGVTKGVVGIGMPIVAIPLLSAVVPLPTAVALLAIPLVVTNLAQAASGDPLWVVLRRLLPILIGMAVGVVVGVYLLTGLRPAILKPVVGSALIALAGLMLLAPKLTCPERIEPVASPLVGIAGGILGGLAGQPGPLVFLYLLSREITGVRFVQYSSMYVLISAIVLTTALGQTGTIGWAGVAVSAACTAPIFVGMWFGARLRQYVPANIVRALILGVVFFGGINLIEPGLHGLIAGQPSYASTSAHPANP